jgi:hypothetical protein
MQAAHKNLKPEDRAKPAGVQTLPAYIVRSHVGIGSVEPSTATDLFPSWYKGANKATGAARTIDVVSNKTATDCTPARARKDINDTVANSFSVDKFVTGGAAASTDASQQDDVHKCDDARPSITALSLSGRTITATVQQGTHPLSSDQFPGTLTFSVDGQVLSGGSISVSSGGSYTFDVPSSSSDQTVTVTLIDSVLYDDVKTIAVNGSGGGGGSQTNGPLVLTKGTVSQTTISFSWTGGKGPYYLTRNGAPTSCWGAAGNGSGGCSVTKVAGSYVLTDSSNPTPLTSNTVTQ